MAVKYFRVVIVVIFAFAGLHVRALSQEAGETVRAFSGHFEYPPSSRVSFRNIRAEWDATSETPAVVIKVAPTAASDDKSAPKVTVESVRAYITTDKGRAWKSYAMKRSASATGSFEVRIEIPEWKAKAKPEADAPGDSPEKGGKNRPSLLQLNEGWVDNATAALCFSAVDSLGNTTAEIAHQQAPKFEKDIFFMDVISDPAEKKAPKDGITYQNSPDRDILGAEIAWVREFIFVRLRIAGTTQINQVVRPGLNYYVVRFIPLETPPGAERYGQGLIDYYMPNPKLFEWSREDPFGKAPFWLFVNEDLARKIAAALSAPDSKLTDDLRNLKKKIISGKYDVSNSLFRKMDFDEANLSAGNLLDRVYWRLQLDKFYVGTNDKTGFKADFFTGWLFDGFETDLKMDDITPYATIYKRHHQMRVGKGTLENGDGEIGWAPPSEAAPVK